MATVYVRNLDEKVNLTTLKKHLTEVMSEFGPCTVYAKKSLRMRGQAFVDFEDPDCADKAIETLDDTEMLGKKVAVGKAKSRSRGIREGAPAKRRKLSPNNILFIPEVHSEVMVREVFNKAEGFVEARLTPTVGFIEFDTSEHAARAVGLFDAVFAKKED